MSRVPDTVLQTEAALGLGRAIEAAGYELEVAPRRGGADLSASRHGTVWLTFHLDVDPRRPLLLRVGATVWSGARVPTDFDVAYDGGADPRLQAFASGRLTLACRRGRQENPDHCLDCPTPSHRA